MPSVKPLIAAIATTACLCISGCFLPPAPTFGESVATGYRSIEIYLGEIECGLEVGAISVETANALKADLLTAEQYLDQAVVGKLVWSDPEGVGMHDQPLQAANKILARVNFEITELLDGGC